MSRRVWIAVGAAVIIAVAVIAFVTYGDLGTQGGPRQQLATWVTDTGLAQDLGALHDDGLDLDKVIAHHRGTEAIHTVCGVLSVTAEAANSNLPSPDTGITQLLARAYTLEYEAGNNCYSAGATDPRLMERSATERADAQRIISEVLGRLAQLTGHTVATTTTTHPTTGTGIFG